MKKILTTFFFIFCITVFSQSIENTGIKICNCINSINEEIIFSKKFNKCYNKIVINSMSLEEKINNNTKFISTKHRLLKNYKKKNCNQIVKKKEVNTTALFCITENSCNCINKISNNLIFLKDSVDLCINKSLLDYYKKQLINDEKTSEFNPQKKIYNLKIDKNTITFFEIEIELKRDCKVLKQLKKENMRTESYSNEDRLNMIKIGVNYIHNIKYKKALKYFIKYQKLFKDDANGLYRLGEALMYNNLNEKAFKVLLESYKISTNNIFHKKLEELITQVYYNLADENKSNIAKKIMNEYNIHF